jgi:hypothetical protein
MDTQTKATSRDVTVRIPEAEVEPRRPETNRWLVVAVAVLAIAVLGLGAGLIVATNDEATTATTPVVPVDPAVTAVLNGTTAALLRGDVTATVGFYAVDGTLVLSDGTRLQGLAAISGWATQAVDTEVKMERVSDVIGSGTFGAALYRYTSVSGNGYMIRVITLDPAGKIVGEEQIEHWPGL